MRILVCGGRDFGRLPESAPPYEISPGVYCRIDKNHPDYLARKAEYDFGITTLYGLCDKYNLWFPADEYGNTLPDNITIIHGGATGVNTIADEWAVVNWTGLEAYRADWDKYGKAAGPIRNKQMLTEGRPDLVVAFSGGRGTAGMIKLAKEAGVEVLEVKYEVP